jgi:6-phosphofructokinase 1
MKKRRIGILCGGGDCAGINPAIKWLVTTALDERWSRQDGIKYEVLGIRDGWKGLTPTRLDFSQNTWPLDQTVVRTWDRYGGTFLGTSRTNPFDPANNLSKTVLSNIEKLGLDVIIAIGGDDTLGVAYKLSQEGVNVIGIPKTIDKDLPGTDYTLGFETALNVITEDIDKLRTTADSHKRIFVVETMGRHAGWLALEGGEAAGAFIILIPEYDFSVKRVNELVLEGKKTGDRYEIIVVAEGAKPKGLSEFAKDDRVDSFGHRSLGGIAAYLAVEIQSATGLEARSTVLSYLQRGGAPCAYDRRIGRNFGIATFDLIRNQDFGKMISFNHGNVDSVPLKEVFGRLKLVDTKTQYDIDRYNGRNHIIND